MQNGVSAAAVTETVDLNIGPMLRTSFAIRVKALALYHGVELALEERKGHLSSDYRISLEGNPKRVGSMRSDLDSIVKKENN
jgi:hypothetical protein